MQVFIDDIEQFLFAIGNAKRIISVDCGVKKTGFASADMILNVAIPLEVIKTEGCKQFLQNQNSIIKIGGVVIGLPRRIDGDGVHQQVYKISQMVAAIVLQMLNIPVLFLDERFSTVFGYNEYQKFLDYKKFKTKKKQPFVDNDDALAALYLLKKVLDCRVRGSV